MPSNSRSDAAPRITSVAFTHVGQSMGVPRADGSLSHAPATAADYAGLLTR